MTLATNPQDIIKTLTEPTDYYLELTREVASGKSIIGTLRLIRPIKKRGAVAKTVVKTWKTLELPDNGNKRNTSCIPNGIYDMLRRTYGGLAKQYRGKFKHPNVWEIGGVINRSAILIHIGNTTKDSRGCPLIGEHSERSNYIKNSVNTYRDFSLL